MIRWWRRRREEQERLAEIQRDQERRMREAKERRPRVDRAGDQLSYLVQQALRGG